MADEHPEPGPVGEPLGPFDGWRAEYLNGLDGDEVVLTLIGVGGADNLVTPLDVDAAEQLGAALVLLTTGRRPEWCQPEDEYPEVTDDDEP